MTVCAGVVATLLMVMPARLAGQQGDLQLTVLGAGDGLPVAQARAGFIVAGRMAATDSWGHAALPWGGSEDTLLVAAIGFRPVRLAVVRSIDTALTIRLTSAPTVLPDLVTTAGRDVRRAGETAAPLSIIPHRELEAKAAASVDVAVGDLPGVQQNGVRPAGTALQIRGLGESRVLLLVDGEPVSGALLENRDLSRTSTLAVDRIEVTRGPTSLEHGSDALGGVINVVTATPEGPFTVIASGLAGGDGRRDGTFGVSAGGPLAFRITGGVRESARVAGQRTGGSTMERIWDLRSTVRGAPGHGWSLRGDANYSRSRQRWPVTVVRNGFVDTWAGGGFLEAERSLPWGSVRVRVVAQNLGYRYREATALVPQRGSDSLDQQERVLRAIAGVRRTTGAHRLSAGFEASARHVLAPGKIAGTAADDRQLEGYLQDGWGGGRWLLTSGARVSTNSRWGSVLTPSVGMAFEASPVLRFRASLSRGFRGPSTKELSWTFPNVAAGYVIEGNPDLRPESAWSLSSGVSWVPAEGLLIQADAYRNAVRDLVEFRTSGTNASGLLIFTPTNVARARTEGIEWSLRAASVSWIATLGYDYLSARNLTADLPLDRRAHHTARLRLTRLIDVLDGAAMDVGIRYSSEAPILPDLSAGAIGRSGTQGDFLSIDAQASVDLMPAMHLALGVDNLLDRHPANTPGVLGRRVYLSVRVEVVP